MRNLKNRLGVIENQRQDLIPPEPVSLFFDPVKHAEYLAENPNAKTILIEAVDARKEKTVEVTP